MPETASAATDLGLISFLKALPDARMRRGIRIPAWYLLLVAVLGILNGCQSLRDEVDGFYWTDSAPDIVNSGREEQGLVSV